MKATVYQLAARVDPGGPMQRRRRYRMHKLHKVNKQQTQFDAHLRRESRTAQTPERMPPSVENRTAQTPERMPPSVENRTDRTDTARQHQPAPSANMRTTWRRAFRHGLMHLRQSSPDTHQTQIGWVMTRLSRSLTDNTYMTEGDIESLVDSLVASAPDYEIGEEAA